MNFILTSLLIVPSVLFAVEQEFPYNTGPASPDGIGKFYQGREISKVMGHCVLFWLEDPDVPIRRLHKLSESQVRKEPEAAGFRRLETSDALPWQHFMVFEKTSEIHMPNQTRN